MPPELLAPPVPTAPLIDRDVFVGRQPIYDRHLSVVAYELLFHGGEQDRHASGLDGDEATAKVLVNTFVEIGLDSVVEQKRAFINFTYDSFLGNYASVFPPDRVVLEVLEDTVVDRSLLAAVGDLSARGYSIALDDFVYQEHLLPLVELADIIKIGLPVIEPSTLAEQVALLRPHGVQLLAEKVETHEEFEYCKQLGFDYFQGYSLCRPNTVRGPRSPTNRLAILELVAKLMDPEVDFNELESLIGHDVSLSYKLLRLANSALFGRAVAFTSIRQALQHLGIDTISTWATIFLLARIGGKPSHLLATAILRAAMCEGLSVAMSRPDSKTFYLVGLFSVLDALLDRPMSDVLGSLSLTDEVNQALLSRNGLLGEVLRRVENYERGNWEEVGGLGVERKSITGAYLGAIAQAREISKLARL